MALSPWTEKNYIQFAAQHLRDTFCEADPVCLTENNDSESIHFTNIDIAGEAGVVINKRGKPRAIFNLCLFCTWVVTRHFDNDDEKDVETGGRVRFELSSEDDLDEMQFVITMEKRIPPTDGREDHQEICLELQEKARKMLPDEVKARIGDFTQILEDKATKKKESSEED